MAMVREWVVRACMLLVLLLLLQQPQAARGQGTCQFARDGECDDPYLTHDTRGKCRPGTDREDCMNSCRYAFDGECDEPRNCVLGTDTADCASTTASSTTASSGSPRPRRPPPGPPAPAATPAHGDDHDFWSVLGAVIGLLTVVFFPCILFMCAWCMCINRRSGLGACGSTRTPIV